MARVEQESGEKLQQAEWDFFSSENAKLKQIERDLEFKLEEAHLEKHQIERALFASAAHEGELEEKVKSMKISVAKAAKASKTSEAQLEQSNLEKFQIERGRSSREQRTKKNSKKTCKI